MSLRMGGFMVFSVVNIYVMVCVCVLVFVGSRLLWCLVMCSMMVLVLNSMREFFL